MENKNERFNGIIQRSVEPMECKVRLLDDENRTVELSFSSETPITRFGDDEILSHKKDAVLLDRLNTGGVVLYNHDRNKVIGKVLKASLKNRRGVATVQFDEDAESNVIYEKVRSGTLKNVSVGYRILDMEHKAVKTDGVTKHIFTATRWEPLEISIVSVPADITVGIGRSMTGTMTTEDCRNTQWFVRQYKINENIMKARAKNE